MTEKEIWDRLYQDIPNPYGVAGLMGNLFAESSLDSCCMTGKDYWLTDKDAKDDYLKMIKNRALSCERFSKDGIAFGLAQWLYWSRKENLYLVTQERGQDICDAKAQLDFLLDEIKTYKTVMNTILTAQNVKEASDIVMERYEKPGNITEKAREKRASFGQGYFDKYALIDTPSQSKRYIVTTKPNVNLRVGNERTYPMAGKAIMVGSKYEWVATADNGWHAIVAKSGKQVMWISGDYCKVTDE